ncbi:alpha/beta fold hydrolase, partial [Pseudomonas aeruginosa]|uniref:alpha/beta fold hydrolase n=1 Tax=Pseudomonas aeruginosa TaxID=287 RepID=UPI0034E8C81C|nr:alpha/beta hydrolase [Pseudomonas aeruginosa]
LQFSISPYTPFMQETKVNLGNGIELHVEVGGEPEHPTIWLIMGLGAQMRFWPDFVCKSLIAQGFRVIRCDSRDSGLSSNVRQQGKRLTTMKLMGRFALGLRNQGAPYT